MRRLHTFMWLALLVLAAERPASAQSEYASGWLELMPAGGWATQWPYSGANDFIRADFNGDGKTDIYARRTSDNAAAFYFSNGDGSFLQVSKWVTQWPYAGVDHIFPLDFNGDGKMDLLARRRSDNAAVFYQSNGNGSFTQVSGWATQWPYSGADEFLTMDFSGDGKTDLLARRRSDNAAVFYRSNGNGSFTMVSPWMTQWLFGSEPNGLRFRTGDFNGDLKIDLFVWRTSDSTGVVVLSNGDGTTATLSWIPYYSGADDFLKVSQMC